MKKPKDFKNKFNPQNVKIFALMLIMILAIVGGIFAFKHMQQLFSQAGRESIVQSIRQNGMLGILQFVGVQILQVVLFVIPGELVEVAGGILYGTVGGYFACTVGTIVGSIIIFCLVRWLGYDFINETINGKFEKLKFLQKKSNLDFVVFFLFFIPGTPKDALTYFIPFTKMPVMRFILISTVARIPSVISSTIAGASLESGNTTLSIVIFAVIAVAGLIGIAIERKYTKEQNESV